MECPNCSVSLTVHTRTAHRLRGRGCRALAARCHYCNFSRVVPKAVPEVRGAVPRARRLRHRAGRGRDRAALSRTRASAASIATRFAGAAAWPRCCDRFAQRRARRAGRHADDREGPRLSAGHAGRRHLGGRRPRPGRLPRRRAHVPAAHAGGRPRRPRRTGGRGDHPDAVSRRTTASAWRRRRTTWRSSTKEIDFRRAMRYPPIIAMVNVVVRGKTYDAAMEARGRPGAPDQRTRSRGAASRCSVRRRRR